MTLDRRRTHAWMERGHFPADHEVERDEAEAPQSPQEGLVGIGPSRRNFLRAMGIGGVVSLSACQRLAARHAVPLLIPDEGIVPGVSTPYASTCVGCAASCGTVMMVRDGRPIKLEGKKDHPISRGGLCARGQAELRGLYDAARPRFPTIDGNKVEWNAIDAAVMAGLRAAKASGKATYVVAHSTTSPTAWHVFDNFSEATGARVVTYDAGTSANRATIDALQALTGAPGLPVPDLEHAELLVVFGADLFGALTSAVPSMAAVAARRWKSEHGKPFRHVHFEGNLSITGGAADERIRATPSERSGAIAVLARKIAAASNDPGSMDALRSAISGDATVPGELGARVDRLAVELLRARGRSVVVSGSRDPSEQFVVALINRMLDNIGKTVRVDAWQPRTRRSAELEAFRADVESDRVGALIVLDANPVEELPWGETLSQKLRTIPLVVAIAHRMTATAEASKHLAAAHHPLEQWGDAAPSDSVWTLAQPGTTPLFATRHPMENFLRWTESPLETYLDQIRDFWSRSVHPHARDGSTFDGFLSAALANGGVVGDVARRALETLIPVPPAPPALGPMTPAKGAEGALEVEFYEDPAIGDGSVAYNTWLRELPDPISRVSWTPTVRIAPRLADGRGIRDGDVVEVRLGQASVRMPARVTPGQHPSVIGVPVGYGMKDGDALEPRRNAYRAMASNFERARTPSEVALEKTSDHVPLPLMQVAMSNEGRPIIYQVGSFASAVPVGHQSEGHSLWDKRVHSPDWQMVVDLDACTGCSACVVACQAENNTPVVGADEIRLHRDMYWLRIDRYFVGDEDNPDMLFEPMMCQQCDNAPCETVCPAAATVHSHDGLNHQVYNRCVGTRYCANNCPYKARRFNWHDHSPKEPIERLVLNPDVVVRDRGVMEKCTFCLQRIQGARIEAKKTGAKTLQVETACQQSCPTRAIRFGDITKDAGDIRELVAKPRAFQVLAEIGVEPSVTYLARVRKGRKDAEGGEHS